MSNYGSNQVAPILVDGYDITGAPTTDVHDQVEALTELNHGLGDNWQKSAYTFLRKFSLGIKGFYDDTAGGIRDAFNDTQNGLQRIICWGLEGNVAGKHFQAFQGAVENSVKRLPSLGVLDKLEIGFASGGGAYEVGQILHVFQTEAGAAGNTQGTSADGSLAGRTNIPISAESQANPTVVACTVPHGLVTNDVIVVAGSNSTPSIDGQQVVTVTDTTHFTVPVNVTVAGNAGSFVQADSDNGGSAYLQVQGLTLGGYTNFAPIIQHSSDNISFSTLVSFATVTTAPQAQRVVVAAGTKIKRYLAAAWSYNGAGAGQSVKFFAGFARAR